MKRWIARLVVVGAVTLAGSTATAQEFGDASQGATFGFDTGVSSRPRTSLSYKTERAQGPSSYQYSIPNYVPQKSSARHRLMMSMPYEYPFAGTLGYSYSGADFAWGNSGTWIGHPQYPGWGYPFAYSSYFGFGR